MKKSRFIVVAILMTALLVGLVMTLGGCGKEEEKKEAEEI